MKSSEKHTVPHGASNESAVDSPLSPAEVIELCKHHPRTIVATVLVAIALGALLLATRPPVYRATASMLLDDEKPGSGVLGDLALLTRPPLATSEIEVLSSRTIAERVVAAAPDGQLVTPANPVQCRNLNLTTLVDDEARRPLSHFFGAARVRPPTPGEPRLFAAIDSGPTEEDAVLRVEFTRSDRVRLSCPGWFGRFTGLASAATEFAYVPGQVIEHQDFRVRFVARGDVTGHRYIVRRIEGSKAVRRVLESTHTAETARNSGVIELSVDDSDPWRAAETANALCVNYLDRNVQRGEKRASQTLTFIDGQLQAQMKSLEAAEHDVVALQGKNPATIDLGQTARAWIDELSALEVERMQLMLSRTALQEALTRLDAGDTDALSRLGPELADPISKSYVEQITALRAQSALQDRSDTGAFKGLLQTKQLELQAESDALGLEIEALDKALSDADAGDPAAYARFATVDIRKKGSDVLVDAYATQLAAQTARLSDLEREFTPEHPDVIAARRGVEDIKARIREIGRGRSSGLVAQRADYEKLLASYQARLGGVPALERSKIAAARTEIEGHARTHLGSRLAGLAQRDRELDEAQAGIEARLVTLPESERALAEPKRRLAAHTEIVNFLLSRQQEAEISRASTVASAEFIDTAAPPIERHGPSIPLYIGGALVIGLMLGLGLAFAFDSVDAGILTSAELEDATGLSVFGAIPDFRSGRYKVDHAGEHFLALRDDPEGAIAEAYRSVRANLKFALSADRELKTFAVTSSSQGEGKSVTNIDLALAFALAGKRVLIVDADMRRPVVHSYLGLSISPGFSDILAGKARWSECVHETNFANLHAITAGKQPGNPGDLLESRNCEVTIREVRDAYDIVVFDVPPALAVADTEGFAGKLDALVLLCRSRKLTRAIVARTTERLRSAGANLIGSVLNADRPNRVESRYGYGYGYGYDTKRSRTPRDSDAFSRTSAQD